MDRVDVRSSHRRCYVRKGVLRNFAKFTGKNQCQSLFFNKAAGFIKRETLAQVFSCEFCEISKNTFFREHLRPTASKLCFRDSKITLFHRYIILPPITFLTWNVYKRIYLVWRLWLIMKESDAIFSFKSIDMSVRFCFKKFSLSEKNV